MFCKKFFTFSESACYILIESMLTLLRSMIPDWYVLLAKAPEGNVKVGRARLTPNGV